jgi:hypothetical protein
VLDGEVKPAGYDRLSLATNAARVGATIMLEKYESVIALSISGNRFSKACKAGHAATRQTQKRLWSDRTGRHHNQMRRSSSAHGMAFDRRNQGPALRTGVASHHAAAVGTLKPIHRLQPRHQQRVALFKRPNRFFDIVRRNAHALKITELRSKTVAPAVHKSAHRPRPSEPKAAQRILLGETAARR